jgi:hypothetical protein
VALSRCKKLSGIKLIHKKVKLSDIIVEGEVVNFINEMKLRDVAPAGGLVAASHSY